MQYRKIVDFGACRALLSRWMGVRDKITAGSSGFMVCVRNEDGSETIDLCGCYENSPEEALRASMKMSWAATKGSESP